MMKKKTINYEPLSFANQCFWAFETVNRSKLWIVHHESMEAPIRLVEMIQIQSTFLNFNTTIC